jgi:hypothetical protein
MATTAIIEKRVNEKFAIGFSYSSPDLAAGETISTVTTTVTTGLTKEGSPTKVGTDQVSQVVSGGTVGNDYNVTFLVTTSAGYIFEDVYIVKVV